MEDLVILNEPLRKQIEAEVLATKSGEDDFKRRDLGKRRVVKQADKGRPR